MSKVWLYIGDSKTYAQYSVDDLKDAVKFSLRHRNKKFIEAAAVKSVMSLVAAEDAPKGIDEFLARSIDMANAYIDVHEPLTREIVFGLGTVAIIGYGLFFVGVRFGQSWAIVSFPLLIVFLFLLALLLMLVTVILWGAIFLFSPEASRQILSELQAVLNGTDKRNA